MTGTSTQQPQQPPPPTTAQHPQQLQQQQQQQQYFYNQGAPPMIWQGQQPPGAEAGAGAGAAMGMFPNPWMMMVRPPMTVSRFDHRHPLFKLGFAGLILATVLFTTGFSVPAWADNTGLWQTCQNSSCYYYVGHGPVWLDAARGMETLALASLVFSVVTEIYQDFCQSTPFTDNKAVEVLGIAAGVFGVIGHVLFETNLENKLRLRFNSYRYETGYDFYYRKPDLTWGFWLSASGLVVGSLSAVLVAFSRIKHAKLTHMALAEQSVYSMPHTVCPAPPLVGYGYPASMPPYYGPPFFPAAAGPPRMMSRQLPQPQFVPNSQVMANQVLQASQMGAAAQAMAASQMMTAQGMPASQLATVQGMPASQMAPVQEMPVSQMATVQGMPASQMATVQGMPASQLATVQGMPVSQMAPVQEMPASQMVPAQEIPASQMAPAQEMPASQIVPAQEMLASQMAPAQEMLASQMALAQEIPASQMAPVQEMATLQETTGAIFTPDPGNTAEEAQPAVNGESDFSRL